MSPWKPSSKPNLLVFAYWIDFFQIAKAFSCRYSLAYYWNSPHLALRAILTSIHDVPHLCCDDTPLNYRLNFIILLRTCFPIVMGRNSVSSWKWRILIVFSTCSIISTSLASFCWRVSIAFFDAGSLTDIDTYVAREFSFFLRGVVAILSNTTYGYITGFVPVLNDIP